MPGFVAEAASFGKPAVICGYYCKEIDKILPKEKIPSSLYCHPNELVGGIERLVLDKNYRENLGCCAYNFVSTQWNYKKVAARFIKLINNDIPTEWLYDPQNIKYVHGAGISELSAKEILKLVIEAGGLQALRLSDKPALERFFIEFAYS